jgi:tripartite-type tricarboxylate transporter receptor subunit TctC
MGLGAAAVAAPGIARAQKFPSGRVTMVVPFPAGAATDISARVYAERLSALWGQPVVIDNKGGGNGIPAAESVARAKPDGLTLFATSAMTQVVNPAIYDKLPYDPIADFAPISRMGTSPFVLLVDRNSPINTAAELTAKLKAEPGKHNYGAGALPARVASELYKMAAGVDAVYVGYKSNPQAIPDVQSGLLTFMMIDTVNAKIAMDRGALKGLFVTDSERYAAVPAMPTAAEAGLPEVLLTTWTGFYAPKGTPAEIVNRINADLYTVSAMPEVVERLAALGGTPKLMRPAEFAAFASAEKERWGQIIRRANIKVE